MNKPNPAGEEWLQKLEAWLFQNQHPDIIYAVAVGHRDGYTSLLSNVGQEHALGFLATFMKITAEEPIVFDAGKQ